MTVDCNSAYVYLDPYKGGMIAVAEAARNITCSGGIPVAITNCLNFGNPHNPEVYYQFVHALKGMGDACIQFETPVTGGNVSFYNQSVLKDKTEPVYPTPTIGMLGILDDVNTFTSLDFKNEGDLIFLLGVQNNEINYSEYLSTIHRIKHAPAPYFDLKSEWKLQSTIQKIISAKTIESAHDISEGGLFISILESAFASQKGINISIPADVRKDIFLFGEAQGRVIVSVSQEKKQSFLSIIEQEGLPYLELGNVGGTELYIDNVCYGSIVEYQKIYLESIQTSIDE